MGRVTTAAKVGVFAVTTVVAGVLIYRFVDRTGGSEHGYTVWAHLDDASGVAKLSQIRMAGIPVGHVKSVRLEDGKARIDLQMDPEVPLYEDAAVSKVMSSLLGEYYLALSSGTQGKRQLGDGDEIHVVVATPSTDDILKDVSKIAQDVKRVSEALAQTVGTDEGREQMKQILQNLAEVTEQLNETVKENRSSVRNILTNVETITSRGEPEVQQILENVRETTREVRTLMAQAPAATDGRTPADGQGQGQGQIRQIIDRVDRASNSLEKTMQSLETVSGRLERGEGTLGRLSKDEQLIDEVQGVAESVGDFMDGIQRLQTIVALRTDYQFRAGTVKSFVELRLQPREDKYYSIEIVNDPRGLTKLEQRTVETTNPNEPPVYFERSETTTNAMRFSLQFAQRFGPMVGRFGIKESTGGVGLDYLMFDDRFELRQDLFGFGERVVPRWRVWLGYEFVPRLWLLGGADDIIDGDKRDYFIGLQLRFNDQDLKTMLPFAPSK